MLHITYNHNDDACFSISVLSHYGMFYVHLDIVSDDLNTTNPGMFYIAFVCESCTGWNTV